MQRKIFIAIDIDERAKNFINKKVDKLKDQLPARWVDKESYHITLSFLGYLEDDDLMELTSAIAEVLRGVEIFDVHLNKMVLAPDKENPKMIWLAGEKNKNIIELRHDIEMIVSGGEIEKREFRPHVNLGKLKGFEAKERALEMTGEIERDIDLLIPVTGVKFFESKVEKKRQQYYIIDSIDFN